MRTCPVCGNTDEEKHIFAVLNEVVHGSDGDTYVGGCGCPACQSTWTEYAYPDGTYGIEDVEDKR